MSEAGLRLSLMITSLTIASGVFEVSLPTLIAASSVGQACSHTPQPVQ